ncbi:hypothetical protein GMDG_01597 [Pseudogymnoascus destructans 20631-21]|uniref:Uncharacterized protein n=2 Tax=Pseudogymnoascus destructans TaxID=655981 RepID=L8FZ81_PSED2|nr:hypothetical protein GMDG_01597 [Pseudogymnoascus destructans 20631-21]
MPKTTPVPLRAPAKPVLQGHSSTPATYFRSPRKILQVKATKSSFLPYGNDEWRSLLDDVKELFRNGRYKECSDRCAASLEQVRGPVHPAHLTYISFYAALCIAIQAQYLELRNPRKLVLLKISLSFYERSEGFLMQANTEQNMSHDGPPKREYKRWDSDSSTRSRNLSVGLPTSTTHTTISGFPLPDNGSDDGFKSPSITGRARTLSMDSTTSDCPAKKDYKNLFNNTIKHYAATPPTPPLSPLEDSLPAKRELKRSGSSSSAHSKTSSIDSILDEFDFSLSWDANSRRSSASSYTSIASKTTTEYISQKQAPQDTAPELYLKPPPPQFLKPSAPPRPRKRSGFAPSLPTIISDSCIAEVAMDSSSISSTASPERYSARTHPLPPLPLITEDIPTCSEIQILSDRKPRSTWGSDTQTLSSPIIPPPSKARSPAPTAVPFRRPLPPLSLAVHQPVSGCRLNFSKPRPVAPPQPSPRTSPETAVEAISLFLLSQSRARYNAHIPEFYSRIKYHMMEVRKMIADVQFKKAALEAEGRPVKTLSIKELKEGTGCAKGVQWKVDKEEVVKRVRRARVEALKRRGEERKPWDGGRYQELCKLALEELKER